MTKAVKDAMVSQQAAGIISASLARRSFTPAMKKKVTEKSRVSALVHASTEITARREKQPDDMGTGSELLGTFDPDDSEANVDRWIDKIDQLGDIHGWSHYKRAYFAQLKLRGVAKKWFYRLDDYKLSWEEWKVKLKNAFPYQEDFGAVLEQLVSRRKRADEYMCSYYYSKMMLLERCGIEGERAVAVLIRGLPAEL